MRTGRRVAAILATLLSAWLPAAAAGAASLYRYVDERGVVHFTDSPSDPRYAEVSPKKPMGPPLPRRTARGLDGVIKQTARLHGLPPALVKAVIRAESNFDPGARSDKGAIGLMQLMPRTAEEMGVEDPWHAEENVRGGTAYLRSMVNRYGDVRLALAAYNAGPHAVDRYGGVPPYPETQQYVQRVLSYYARYDGDFGK